MKKTPIERAAQLWCLPAFAHKEMDVPFAEAIAGTIQEGMNEVIEEAAMIMESAACKRCRFPLPPDACDGAGESTSHSTCMNILKKARKVRTLMVAK